ncbi:DNA polymerase I [Mycobacterium phage Vincenzo]|uniref:DNA polymerase n=2 Tax=Coopervirus vincenzo TaxID=1983110 RepID=A0A0F6YQF7_9CAUD|nr:DNA polymerase I [Mycobacterium phage Vincenzo]AKF14318.1 DNA polymerase I [Mycobacterium phage Vincenzo]AKF14722.1 DNA polymerase I [Mycobacterium phage AlanGrant]
MTQTSAVPRVPSRAWYDPLLGATMATGHEAVRAADRFINGYDFRSQPIAFDIETPGLDNVFTINCVTAAWTTPDGGVQTILLDPQRDQNHFEVTVALLHHASWVIFHNAPFDVPPLYHAGLITDSTIKRIVDTLLITRFAVPDVMVPKNLTALSVRHLGLTDDKGGLERAFKAAGYKTQAAGFEGMDITSPVYRYGAMADTVATLAVEPIMRAKAHHWATDHPFVTYGATTEAEAEQLLWTQETVHRVMLRRSAVGLAVDMDYLDRYQEQVDVDRNLAIAELAAHGLEGGSGKGKALVQYLYDRGELPANWPRTPTKQLRATKADLEALDHPLADAQRKLAVIDKVTGYLEKVSRQAAVTGRCHPQVGVLGASATGRMSYGSPELQQFPADARPIITDDGQGLTSIDWSQIEPVTMALMAQDVEFLAPFEAGEDLYEPIMRSAGIERPVAKVVLLGTMYGLGTAKLARNIGHTEESAAQIRRQMFEAMKGCERWMRKVQNVAETYGRVVTAGGRILPVDPGFEYKAVNYAIQGSAYDVLAASIVEMERQGLADHLQLAMHDELVVDTEVAEAVQRIMLTPPPFLITWAQRTPVLRTDRADMGRAWAKV